MSWIDDLLNRINFKDYYPQGKSTGKNQIIINCVFKSDPQVSFENLIDNLKSDNERLAREAEEAVKESFTPPEVIKRVLHTKPGYEEMNIFLEELQGGLS